MELLFSPLALEKIELLLDYLEAEYSRESRNQYLEKLKKKLEQIREYPESATRSSKYANLFKCVVSRQSAFYYRVLDNRIEIITLIDTRQNPELAQKEIAESVD